MSASNWTFCPRCFDDARRKADEEKVAVMGTYGTVPVEEFDAAREALVDPESDDFRTFREDYEFYGAETGVVAVDYKGECTVCGLGVTLVDSRKFWPGANDR